MVLKNYKYGKKQNEADQVTAVMYYVCGSMQMHVEGRTRDTFE
jgi:hypothetical protein